MTTRIRRLLFMVWCVLLGAPVWATPVAGLSKVYVFGDSLSDSGAGIALINAICRSPLTGSTACGAQRNSVTLASPYFEGKRISDGPTSVEVMNSLLGMSEMRPGYSVPFVGNAVGENFAIHAARVKGRDTAAQLVDLAAQVSAFKAQNPSADSQALYVFFIGGNDLIDAISSSNHGWVADAVAGIQTQIDALAAAGARRFLVYKLINLAELPLYAQASAATKATAASYTADFNAGIDGLTTSKTGQAIHRFNLSALWSFVKQYAFDKGLNYRDACGSLPNVTDVIRNSQGPDVVISIGTPNCGSGIANRFFLDAEHPSGLLHQLIGAASYDFVVEQLNGSCATHSWSADTLARVGDPMVRRGLPGSIYSYQNPYSTTLDFFRLVSTGSDSAYWYYPTNQQDNAYWQYLGHSLPDASHCGSNFRSTMNFWSARAVQSSVNGGVAAGQFTVAPAGSLFFYSNPYTNKAEVFKFADPNQNGSYWYFPIDGVSNNNWWTRVSPTHW